MKKIVGILSIIAIILSGCQQGLTEKEKKAYAVKGKEIAQATAKRLGGELKLKMKNGGVQKAVPFCNAKANDLTNEMSKKLNASIKRTSHKLRNKDNAPNTKEKEMITHFQKLIAKGQKLKPVIEADTEGKVHFYAPIKLQKKCLVCHGVLGESMKHESDSIIKVLYPDDKAIGFKEGDLRAIWSIAFND
jgi:cytochrome c